MERHAQAGTNYTRRVHRSTNLAPHGERTMSESKAHPITRIEKLEQDLELLQRVCLKLFTPAQFIEAIEAIKAEGAEAA